MRLRQTFARRAAEGDRGDPGHQLTRELLRSRRYGHPFVLGRIRPERSRHRAAARTSSELAPALSVILRRTDLIWSTRNAVFFVLPESDRRIADAIETRLRHDATGLELAEAVRLAVFPRDGLTSSALLAALDGRRVDPHVTPASWLDAQARGRTGPPSAERDDVAQRK